MQEWEKIARTLPCGRTKRINCCRKDVSQVISHTEKGYSTYCFRCGDGSRKFVSHGTRSLKDMIKHRKELNEYMATQGELELPYDFDTDIPDYGRVWLLKGGVGSALIEHYGFGWSECMNRVVLPVYEDGELTAVQSRSVWDAMKPKYLNKKGSSNCMFWHDPEVQLDRITDELVITEDILSTVRVGRLNDCVSTLGTSLSDRMATQLLENYSNFAVWYDGDEAGVRGARKACKALMMQGGVVRVIRTKLDPKEYNNEEISTILLNDVPSELLE